MTQDEIISIYKEVSNKICNGTEWCWSGASEPLKLFANLVAAKEREECARVCEDLHPGLATLVAAQHIRARGEQA